MGLILPKKGLIVLNYSFGPYWNEEIGGEDALTIWNVLRGKINQVYHPGEPDEIDNGRPMLLLKERGIKEVYTPSIDLYLKTNNLLGLKMRYEGGEHTDGDGVTDWFEYSGLCIDDNHSDRLRSAGLDLLFFDSVEGV